MDVPKPVEVRVTDKRGQPADKPEVSETRGSAPADPTSEGSVAGSEREGTPAAPPPPMHPFRQGEQVPLKGVWWLVADIGQKGEMVLFPVGLTKDTQKKMKAAKRRGH